MHYANFGMLLCLSIEIASLLVPAGASPSFRFTKAPGISSNHHDPASLTPSSSNSSLSDEQQPLDVARLCPLAFSHKDAANERKMKHEIARLKNLRLQEYTKVTIPVVFHVVAANTSVEGGHISHRNLEQQIKVLNQDFAKANVAFKLEKIYRIENSGWFMDVGVNNKVASEMHAATREGNEKTLNVWTTSFSKVTYTGGYAQYPWDYNSRPKDDGITIRHDYIYGGQHWLFHDGRYLTHEAGHWVGLFHTFEQENCNSNGDYVDDTPAQKSASDPTDKSCKAKDTCKTNSGTDPISNFMDYSNPRCQSQFTQGQINRMRSALGQFRGYPY